MGDRDEKELHLALLFVILLFFFINRAQGVGKCDPVSFGMVNPSRRSGCRSSGSEYDYFFLAKLRKGYPCDFVGNRKQSRNQSSNIYQCIIDIGEKSIVPKAVLSASIG